jgi:hypothetical protein
MFYDDNNDDDDDYISLPPFVGPWPLFHCLNPILSLDNYRINASSGIRNHDPSV